MRSHDAPTPSIQKDYRINKNLLPSMQPGSQVVAATRRKDKLPVIIKIRAKKRSFQSAKHETDWLAQTKSLMNAMGSWGRGGGGMCKILEVVETNASYCVVMERGRGLDLFSHLLELKKMRESWGADYYSKAERIEDAQVLLGRIFVWGGDGGYDQDCCWSC